MAGPLCQAQRARTNFRLKVAAASIQYWPQPLAGGRCPRATVLPAVLDRRMSSHFELSPF